MPGKPQFRQQQKRGSAADRIRKDAEGQFAPKKHGGKNNGLDSAAPVVTTGDGDATFDDDPAGSTGDKDR